MIQVQERKKDSAERKGTAQVGELDSSSKSFLDALEMRVATFCTSCRALSQSPVFNASRTLGKYETSLEFSAWLEKSMTGLIRK